MQHAAAVERGQALAETALVIPIVAFLVSATVLAAFATYRAVATDWGVFVNGVAAGAYSGSVDMRTGVPWQDIRNGLNIEANPAGRQVQSSISVTIDRPFMFGTRIQETQSGSATFRLWRFYPGRPPSVWR